MLGKPCIHERKQSVIIDAWISFKNLLQAMMIRKAMENSEIKKRKRSDSDEDIGRVKVNFTRPRCYKEETEDVEKDVEEADGKLQHMEISDDK